MDTIIIGAAFRKAALFSGRGRCGVTSIQQVDIRPLLTVLQRLIDLLAEPKDIPAISDRY
jgi:hypothetical protein